MTENEALLFAAQIKVIKAVLELTVGLRRIMPPGDSEIAANVQAAMGAADEAIDLLTELRNRE